MASLSRPWFLACLLVLVAISLLVRARVETARHSRDLPIAEVPADGKDSDLFAVLVSGDGGWARLDQGLSAELARRGIPVAGLSSLSYFWHTRTPDETAADLGRIIEMYSSRWHRRRVLLIGYSFGADVMPAVFNRLSPQIRARVVSISLLGLARRATYEVSAGELLPSAAAKGDLVLPEVLKIGALPVLCIEGAGETHSICPKLRPLGIAVRQIGQRHHFSYREAEIADAVLAVAREVPHQAGAYPKPLRVRDYG